MTTWNKPHLIRVGQIVRHGTRTGKVTHVGKVYVWIRWKLGAKPRRMHPDNLH